MSESSSTGGGSAVKKATAGGGKGTFVKMALTALVLLLLAGAGVYFTFEFTEAERQREMKQWQIRLGIVADSRFADIDKWIDAQQNELQALAENASLQLYMSLIEEAGVDISDSPEAGFLKNLLTVVAERSGFKGEIQGAEVSANVARVGVAGIALINKANEILVASPGMPPILAKLAEFVNGAKKGERAASDLYVGTGGKPTMAFIAPVFSVQGDQDAASQIGAIVGVKEVAGELYPRLKQPGNVDKTAEAVLVRKAATAAEYMSPLLDKTAALKKKLSLETPELAAAFALATPGGFAIKRDYRDAEVLVTVRAFTQVPWTLMYKIDTAESLAEAEDRLKTTVGAFIAIIVLVFIGLIAVWFKGSSKRANESAAQFEEISKRFQGQRNFMHLVTDSQPNSIVVFDDAASYRWFNQVALDASGVDRRDLFDKHVTAILGPIEGKRIAGWIKECLDKFEPLHFTHTMEIGEAGERVYRSDFMPLEERDEMPPGVLMVSQDITDSVREREQRERVMRQLVDLLVGVVDRRDPYAANQSNRTGIVARAIAGEMGLDPAVVETVGIAGSLMNLGKITVPQEVLTKSGQLTDEESRMIRESILASAELIGDIEFDGNVAETIRHTLEDFDGSGIPDGLAGDDIPVTSRIVTVASAFVSRASQRAYRPAQDFDTAADALHQSIGSRYDRAVVSALTNYIDNRDGREAWRDFGDAPQEVGE